jgi:hypothetical protein
VLPEDPAPVLIAGLRRARYGTDCSICGGGNSESAFNTENPAFTGCFSRIVRPRSDVFEYSLLQYVAAKYQTMFWLGQRD